MYLNSKLWLQTDELLVEGDNENAEFATFSVGRLTIVHSLQKRNNKSIGIKYVHFLVVQNVASKNFLEKIFVSDIIYNYSSYG